MHVYQAPAVQGALWRKLGMYWPMSSQQFCCVKPPAGPRWNRVGLLPELRGQDQPWCMLRRAHLVQIWGQRVLPKESDIHTGKMRGGRSSLWKSPGQIPSSSGLSILSLIHSTTIYWKPAVCRMLDLQGGIRQELAVTKPHPGWRNAGVQGILGITTDKLQTWYHNDT